MNHSLITEILHRSGHPLDFHGMFPNADADEVIKQVGQHLAATALVYWLQDAHEAGTNFEAIRSQLPEWALKYIKASDPDPDNIESAADALESTACTTTWEALGSSALPQPA